MEGDPVLLGLSALLAAEERLELEPAYSVAEPFPHKNAAVPAHPKEDATLPRQITDSAQCAAEFGS